MKLAHSFDVKIHDSLKKCRERYLGLRGINIRISSTVFPMGECRKEGYTCIKSTCLESLQAVSMLALPGQCSFFAGRWSGHLPEVLAGQLLWEAVVIPKAEFLISFRDTGCCIYGGANFSCQRVDSNRIKEVGPDRACAEWLMKNGAFVKWENESDFLKNYDCLPPEDDRRHIVEVDATEASITHIGFAHFKLAKNPATTMTRPIKTPATTSEPRPPKMLPLPSAKSTPPSEGKTRKLPS
uniref:Uncharacterized protein n=1 Tax=Timema genevievae TaxID=629358 RepID=A0A7R9PJN5_TIMGE|nr:unnamed protein product [Timema genevievae]